MNVGFIGLGEMGYPIASNIIKAKFCLTVYNRTISKAKKFSKTFNCKYQKSIKQLCQNLDVIILCLTTDIVVEDIVNQVIKHIKPGSIIIDNSTVDVEVAQKLYNKAKKKKIYFLDAPLTGSSIWAKQGKLGIMVGGDKIAFKKVIKILRAYATTIEYMGASGQGQLTKISNEIVSLNIKHGLLECLDFANKYNIKRKKLVNILINGSASSYQLKKYLKPILAKTHEKERPYPKKSIYLAIKNAKRKKLRLPCTEQIAKIVQQ